jgi:outer membrane protein assembly factor BamB
VYNKEILKETTVAAIRLNYLRPDTLNAIAVSPRPDYSINQLYKNRVLVAEWTDTASIFTGPCLVNDSVLIYGNSLGLIKAIDIISKATIWQKQIQGPLYSTPVESEGILVLGTVNGSVIGLNAMNGKLLWSVTTGRPVLAEGLIDNGSVYIGGGDRGFYSLDLHSGKIMWQFTGVSGLIQGRPVISGSSVLFGAWDTHFYCLDKHSGVLKWKWTNGKPQKLYSPGNIFPVVSGERVFIVAPDRFMTALDLNTGRQIWRTGRHQVRESMGISPGGEMIYSKLMNDTVVAISAKGNPPVTIWSSNAGFGYEHNPCPLAATDSQVIAATRNGLVAAIVPSNGNVLWKYKAGNSSVNKIVTGRSGTIWLTLMEGKILGIETIQNQ